jgi:hypothetical protein
VLHHRQLDVDQQQMIGLGLAASHQRPVESAELRAR